MSRVLIAVPTFENITPDTFKALWDMEKPSEHQFIFEFVRGHDCATARNNIVMRAQEIGADYLMMVDSDTTPPGRAFVNLYEHGVDVVMGYYMHRDLDTNAITSKTNACKLADASGKRYFGYPGESQLTGDELREKRKNGEYLLQIHGGGMGCILINMRVFDEVQYPWFDWANYPNDERGTLSEDLYFCENLHNEGIPIYVDTRVACGHLMRRVEYV